MDAVKKEILEDTLIDVKFSGLSWKNNEGFFYSSYDKPEGSELSAKTDQHKLYYHKLGTAQSEDKVIRSEEHTLNSSHVRISYAVFCLKKKNKYKKKKYE